MNERKRPDLPPGTEVAGFVVEAFLGAGGFGTVYRVRRPQTGERFALKLIPLAFAEDWGLRESSILLRVRHLNLVMLWGSGYWSSEHGEYLWIQLEYIDGRELDVWADEENPDALEVSAKVLGVARGLAVAHEARVVHRDVKEANILVRERDGEAVLLDFGVGFYSRALPATEGMFPPGTIDYRSPEAWRFRQEHFTQLGARYRAGPSDDLYALGVVLYRLLTGRHPFTVTESERSIQAVIHQPPLAPHLLNPRVPPALSQVCLTLLAKSPRERYPDAVALYDALNLARRRADASWRVPLAGPRRPTRRHVPTAVVAWTGVVSGMLVLGALGFWRLNAGPEPQAPSRVEVARSAPPPEAPLTAAPPPVEPTPAVAALPAAPAQDRAPVKKTSPRNAPRQTSQHGGRTSTCVGLAGLALQACVTAQPVVAPPVYLPPPPEECPAGAKETLSKVFHLGLGNYYSARMPGVPLGPVTVREGNFSTAMATTYGGLPEDTLLFGKLYYTPTLLYVRLTQARLPTGEVYPICMEMRERDASGVTPAKGSTPHNIRIFSAWGVYPVERFE